MAQLYFYFASMNAGKSSTLLQTAFNYGNGMRVSLWTAALGNVGWRDLEPDRPVDDAHRYEATPISSRVLADHGEQPIACVLIDEAQFLTEAQVWQCARRPTTRVFPCSAMAAHRFPGRALEFVLLSLADALIELKAVTIGRKATMNLRVDAQGRAVREAHRPRSRDRPLCRHVPQALLRSMAGWGRVPYQPA